MAKWQVVIPIAENNRQMSLKQNDTDTNITDFQLLDDQDVVLATIQLTTDEVSSLGVLVGQAKSNKTLAGL